MTVLSGIVLVVACAPLAIITLALLSAVYQSLTEQGDDHADH